MKTKTTLLLLFITLMLNGCSTLSSSNLESQEKCSKSAKGFFSNYMENYGMEYTGNSYSFTNHYSQNLNKCFILITNDNEPYEFHEILYDVYENKEYGGIHTADQISGICGLGLGDSYKACEHLGEDNSAVHAKEEFNDMVKQYMEN
ncbi:MAG: hypothetical protein ABID64_04385 [Nitrospirota bacterium]